MQIRAGVIGYGFAARKIHIPSLARCGAQVIGVADNDKATLAEAPAGIQKFTDYHELLDKRPDMVSICTPDHLHSEMCVEAAEAGINVLLEKPLALSSKDANRVLHASKDNSVQVCMVHQFHYFEPFMKLKTISEQHGICLAGKILYLHGKSPGALPREYIENPSTAVPLPFHVVHPFYLLEWIFGRPRAVAGKRIGESFYGLFETNSYAVHLDLSQSPSPGRHLLKVEGNYSDVTVEAADPPGLWVVGHTARSQMRLGAESFVDQAWRLWRLLASYSINKNIQYSLGSSEILIGKFVESLRKGSDPPISLEEASNAVHYTECYYEACVKQTRVEI